VPLSWNRLLLPGKTHAKHNARAFDALPLLKTAAHVTVVEVCADQELAAARTHIEDVVGWLKSHGVVAESYASPSIGDDASLLKAIAREQGADLIVAGAYGHSRMREWVLGGVTRDLLLRAVQFALLSH